MADGPAGRGLVDTSVVIELDRVTPHELPAQIAIAAVTLAELAAGPHATTDPAERAGRQERLQRAEAIFQAIPFDTATARAYGRVYAQVAASGRKARGKRALDLLIAATALAADLPLHTRNPFDFDGLGDLLDVVSVSAEASQLTMTRAQGCARGRSLLARSAPTRRSSAAMDCRAASSTRPSPVLARTRNRRQHSPGAARVLGEDVKQDAAVDDDPGGWGHRRVRARISSVLSAASPAPRMRALPGRADASPDMTAPAGSVT